MTIDRLNNIFETQGVFVRAVQGDAHVTVYESDFFYTEKGKVLAIIPFSDSTTESNVAEGLLDVHKLTLEEALKRALVLGYSDHLLGKLVLERLEITLGTGNPSLKYVDLMATTITPEVFEAHFGIVEDRKPGNYVTVETWKPTDASWEFFDNLAEAFEG